MREPTEHDREVCASKKHHQLEASARAVAHRSNDLNGSDLMSVYQCVVRRLWCCTSQGLKHRPKQESRVSSRRKVIGTRTRNRSNRRVAGPLTPDE